MIECLHDAGYYRPDLKLLICRPKGVITKDRAQDLFICQQCLKKANLTDVNRFHDLTGITGVDLHFSDVSSLTHHEALFRRDSDVRIKACYWVPNDAVYGIVRMYQTLMESHGVDVYVSRRISDLAEVLGVAETELVGEPILQAANSRKQAQAG